MAETQRFDAIVLDLMLPRLNGFRVCQLLRERGDDTPVLVLTAKQGDWDETEALENEGHGLRGEVKPDDGHQIWEVQVDASGKVVSDQLDD